jgi:hypothetical protein
MERVIIPERPYKHFKGKLYYVYDIFEHTETGEKFVAYQALYKPYKKYVRPLDMFASKVDLEKYPDVLQEYRFELYDGEKVL